MMPLRDREIVVKKVGGKVALVGAIIESKLLRKCG